MVVAALLVVDEGALCVFVGVWRVRAGGCEWLAAGCCATESGIRPTRRRGKASTTRSRQARAASGRLVRVVSVLLLLGRIVVAPVVGGLGVVRFLVPLPVVCDGDHLAVPVLAVLDHEYVVVWRKEKAKKSAAKLEMR